MGAGTVAGLFIGVFIGRATVTVNADPAVSTDQKSLKNSPAEEQAPSAEPQAPARYFNADLGRRLPGGNESRGFGRERHENRSVARLESADAKLHVRYKAIEGESYALTAIVLLDADDEAKLKVGLDGQSLGTWTVAKGWGFYSSPIPDALLATAEHDIALTTNELAKDAAVRFDSIAMVPVDDELSFAIGKDARPHLVEGFSGGESKSVWSDGSRSVIGVAMAPRSTPYELRVRGSAYPPLSPLTVRLDVNGVEVGTATVTKKVEDATWTIPANALRVGPNLLAFEYARTGQPAKLKPGSKDERALAMRFFRVDLVPAE